MPPIVTPHPTRPSPRDWMDSTIAKVSAGAIGVCALAALSASATPARAAALSLSVDVNGSPAAVWAVIGPFCAIKEWHPSIATCTEDGGDPPIRTLVTRDGKTTFVEPQIARNDVAHFYSYSFKSSPFPVKRYAATISVVPRGETGSTVIWRGVYVPKAGLQQEANDDFTAVYRTGLEAIRARFAN